MRQRVKLKAKPPIGSLVQARRCPWCGRSGVDCWILPCLTLETAIASADELALLAFAAAVGATLTKRGNAVRASR